MLINNWIIRVRFPQSTTGSRIILLLHGLSGNEESMTVFIRNLPTDAWIISPRAPFPADSKGYSWIPSQQGLKASFQEFRESVNSLFQALSGWKNALNIPDGTISVAGFSQGAALAGASLLVFPHLIEQTACLSGFLPEDTPAYVSPGQLQGKTIFIAHGSQDKTVPVEKARRTAAWLTEWGAKVIYCEAPVGHRLSANCFRSFADYYRNPE